MLYVSRRVQDYSTYDSGKEYAIAAQQDSGQENVCWKHQYTWISKYSQGIPEENRRAHILHCSVETLFQKWDIGLVEVICQIDPEASVALKIKTWRARSVMQRRGSLASLLPVLWDAEACSTVDQEYQYQLVKHILHTSVRDTGFYR